MAPRREQYTIPKGETATRISLRMTQRLLDALDAEAQQNGRSLNAEIVVRLQESLEQQSKEQER